MNSMQIKAKIKNISNKKNIDFNTVLRLYMYDRFIERLAVSKYKDNFIIKGGFYLSSFFGVENRATMDIDAAITKINFNKDNIIKIIREIISIDIRDNATLELIEISQIRQEDEYGGYRVVIKVKIENMRETFQIDMATGDPITPRAIVYNYLPTLSEKPIKLWSYNNETVLAEKLETILNRAEANSRIRDFYDIYLIYNLAKDKLNINTLRKAVENTFNKRKFNKDINKTFQIIQNSEILKTRWLAYTRKYKYASKITYENIMDGLKWLIQTTDKVNV